MEEKLQILAETNGIGPFVKFQHAGSRPAKDNGEILEYPFLTMSRYPEGFILKIGMSCTYLLLIKGTAGF